MSSSKVDFSLSRRNFVRMFGAGMTLATTLRASAHLLARFQSISPEIRLRNVASISLISAAGAGASLRDLSLIPTRRKINTDVREATLEFLEENGYKYLRGSQANFFMVAMWFHCSEFVVGEQVETADRRTWSELS